MGYPFDRNADKRFWIKDFVTNTRDPDEGDVSQSAISNIKLINILIEHVPGEPEDGPTITHA